MRMRSGPADVLPFPPAARFNARAQGNVTQFPSPPLAHQDHAGGRDEQLGQIFRNMRLAVKVPRETIARRLATSPATIDAFEAGAVGALPHWNETCRIVRGYCELLRLDAEPILWRVRSHLQAFASPPPRPVPAPLQAAPPVAAPYPRSSRAQSAPSQDEDDGRPAGRRRGRTLFALSAPVLLAAGVLAMTQTAPQPVYAAIGWLPDRIEVPLRAGLDYAVQLTAPSRDGLRWIDIGDPQLRKADKLHTSTR